MGQPISVLTSSSSKPGTARFEINRTLTGMGHERYVAGQVIDADRPPDRLARVLLEFDGVQSVHIYANMITLELSHGVDMDALKDAIEGLYIYYRPGVEVPSLEPASVDS